MRNRVVENILSELYSFMYYEWHGRELYSNELIWFVLVLRYTSRQAYNLLSDEFPFPLFSYLKASTQGGIKPIKALKYLLKKEKKSTDSVFLIDEIYLQISVQYHGGKFVGKDENGEFYLEVVVFMLVSIKLSIPFVVKACP